MSGGAHVPRDPTDAFCDSSQRQRDVVGYVTHAMPRHAMSTHPIPSSFPWQAGGSSADLLRIQVCPPFAPESPKQQPCRVGGCNEASTTTLMLIELYPAQPQQPTLSIPCHSPSQFLAVASLGCAGSPPALPVFALQHCLDSL